MQSTMSMTGKCFSPSSIFHAWACARTRDKTAVIVTASARTIINGGITTYFDRHFGELSAARRICYNSLCVAPVRWKRKNRLSVPALTMQEQEPIRHYQPIESTEFDIVPQGRAVSYWSTPHNFPHGVAFHDGPLYSSADVTINSRLLHVNKTRETTQYGGDTWELHVVDTPQYLLVLQATSDGLTASGHSRDLWLDAITRHKDTCRKAEEKYQRSFSWEAGPDVIFQQLMQYYAQAKGIADLFPQEENLTRRNWHNIWSAALKEPGTSDETRQFIPDRYPLVQKALSSYLEDFYAQRSFQLLCSAHVIRNITGTSLPDSYYVNGPWSIAGTIIRKPTKEMPAFLSVVQTVTSHADITAHIDTPMLEMYYQETNSNKRHFLLGLPDPDSGYDIQVANYDSNAIYDDLLARTPNPQERHTALMEKPGVLYATWGHGREHAHASRLKEEERTAHINVSFGQATDGIQKNRDLSRGSLGAEAYMERVSDFHTTPPDLFLQKVTQGETIADDIAISLTDIECT